MANEVKETKEVKVEEQKTKKTAKEFMKETWTKVKGSKVVKIIGVGLVGAAGFVLGAKSAEAKINGTDLISEEEPEDEETETEITAEVQ